MTKNEIVELLTKLDMAPSKKLGQNFLIDQNIIDLIVRTVNPHAGENILEIGPGTGVLTSRLVAAKANVTAVEFDWRLAGYIRETYGSGDGFRLIESDACKLDYDEVMGDASYRCIANLPYAISSIFLSMLASAENPPKQIFVMLQKEMADRMAAKPNTKAYGALSVRMQALYDVSIARKIPNTVFHPNPDVDSALMNAEIPEGRIIHSKAFRKRLEEIAKLAFSQRRKQVRKLLGQRFQTPFILQFFADNGIAESARAEEITVAQYIKLTEATLKE
ncbi:MAG: 16S rRNA (adenine(1518)-N(6)/adenine(1519)-N(6))-dimethyltransferase RsmA [Lentisphaeria bacterium]